MMNQRKKPKRRRAVTVLKVLAGLILLIVLLFIFVPAPADATARAKISEALLAMSPARTELAGLCEKGGWETGVTYESLGLPKFIPDNYVQEIGVRVISSQRAVVRAKLMEIRSDIIANWSTLTIPAGAILEFEVRCTNGVASAGPSLGTNVPRKYLPQYLRP